MLPTPLFHTLSALIALFRSPLPLLPAPRDHQELARLEEELVGMHDPSYEGDSAGAAPSPSQQTPRSQIRSVLDLFGPPAPRANGSAAAAAAASAAGREAPRPPGALVSEEVLCRLHALIFTSLPVRLGGMMGE